MDNNVLELLPDGRRAGGSSYYEALSPLVWQGSQETRHERCWRNGDFSVL